MFVLAAVLRVPAPRDCGAGMQIKPARGLMCTEQPEVPVALWGLRGEWGVTAKAWHLLEFL